MQAGIPGRCWRSTQRNWGRPRRRMSRFQALSAGKAAAPMWCSRRHPAGGGEVAVTRCPARVQAWELAQEQAPGPAQVQGPLPWCRCRHRHRQAASESAPSRVSAASIDVVHAPHCRGLKKQRAPRRAPFPDSLTAVSAGQLLLDDHRAVLLRMHHAALFQILHDAADHLARGADHLILAMILARDLVADELHAVLHLGHVEQRARRGRRRRAGPAIRSAGRRCAGAAPDRA